MLTLLESTHHLDHGHGHDHGHEHHDDDDRLLACYDTSCHDPCSEDNCDLPGAVAEPCDECVVDCEKCDEAERDHKMKKRKQCASSSPSSMELKFDYPAAAAVAAANTNSFRMLRFEDAFQPRVSNSRDEYRLKRQRVGDFDDSAASSLLYCHWDDHDDNVKFQNQMDLDAHLRKQHMPMPEEIRNDLSCHWDSCFESASEVDELMRHIQTQHLPHSTQPHDNCSHKHKVLTPQEILSCQWDNCDFYANDLQSLDSHMLKHTSGTIDNHNNHHHHNLHHHQKIEHINPYMCEMNTCSFASFDINAMIQHNRQEHHLDHQPALTFSHPASHFTPLASASSSSSESSISSIKCEDTLTAAHHQQQQQHLTPLSSPEPLFPPSSEPHVCHWILENGTRCNKHHSSPATLSEHVIADHIGSRKPQYTCQWEGCERNHRPFSQRQKIIRHFQTHSKNKPFVCSVCKASFGEEFVLKQHERIHSGEKPFSCKFCNKKFAASTALSVHLRTHTGEKPLVCKFDGCGKRFSESSNLTKHMKTHVSTDGGNWTCEKFGCGTRFISKQQMDDHVARVHGL